MHRNNYTHSYRILYFKHPNIVHQHVTIFSNAPYCNSNKGFLMKIFEQTFKLSDTNIKHILLFKNEDLNVQADSLQCTYIYQKEKLNTCSTDVWHALYKALTVYPWRSEALLIATIRACHTSSFTKFPAY